MQITGLSESIKNKVGEEEYNETLEKNKSVAALNVMMGNNIYGGTANKKRVSKRRAKNRVAGKSRKANRHR